MNLEYDEILESAARVTPQYVAGLFDGEGSVCVTCSGVNHPRLKVTITNTDLRILALVGLKFPGGGPHSARSPRLRHELYQLGYTGKSCKPLLEFIKDHVIIKRERVLLGLQMVELTNERGNDLTEEQKIERWRIGLEMTKLNDSARKNVSILSSNFAKSSSLGKEE